MDQRIINLYDRFTHGGKGIETDHLNDPKSLGLRRMKERARLLGGDLRIAGAPGEGTTAVLRIPLAVP